MKWLNHCKLSRQKIFQQLPLREIVPFGNGISNTQSLTLFTPTGRQQNNELSLSEKFPNYLGLCIPIEADQTNLSFITGSSG